MMDDDLVNAGVHLAYGRMEIDSVPLVGYFSPSWGEYRMHFLRFSRQTVEDDLTEMAFRHWATPKEGERHV